MNESFGAGYERLLVRVEGGIAHVTQDRPERLNALDLHAVDELGNPKERFR